MPDTPKPQQGTWTLIAPDCNRSWQAESPLRCVALEQSERIPAAVALQRIFDAASADHDWLPIDSAPKDGTRVLLFEFGTRGGVFVGHWLTWKPDPIRTGWVTNAGHKFRPTYWMPLPQPPKDPQ